ncbi:hypothetical protein B5V90_02030 [Heyndrickxia sporothermodurans]|jgi:hypothetical protein|nr:hypothetical protein B5V90_02030 [Heyndrickxia sporothermodurans]
MENINEYIIQLMDRLSEGNLVQFRLHSGQSIGIVITAENTYTVLGLKGMTFEFEDEVRAFMIGLLIGSDDVQVLTKNEAMLKANQGHFKNK